MVYDLYSAENEIINRAESLLEDGKDAANIPRDDFANLIKQYRKLFKRTKQLVRLNDRNEIDLRQAKSSAEAATKAKADFLAAMSHEIRTPMNGVVGMIDLLRETSLDTDQQHMMQTVRDSAFALLNIINDILDSSKIEAGKLNLEILPISMEAIIDGVAETLLSNANEKSVRLITFVDPGLPEQIMADPVRIRQILFNLAGNAVKFTENTPDNPGRVIIRADFVENWRPSQDGISLQITDMGIGMSEEALSNLFKPFTQAEGSTTRRFGGTGLGLSICKNLADIMGGEIGVESEQGVGSTFTVTLPVEPSTTDPDKEDPLTLSELNILTVFANPMEADFALRYMTHQGATGQKANTLDEARTMIGSGNPIHVVVINGGDKRDVDDLRAMAEELCIVLLDSDRTAPKGLIQPGVVSVGSSPLPRRSLLRAVGLATGRLAEDVTSENSGSTRIKRKAPSREDAKTLGQLILVAEDNLTNQDVIRRQLDLLGYACEISSDGVEALKAWESGDYGALLTDCHMPHMDGYQLTQAIRQAEQIGTARIPIIAITASTLQGEGEHCLEIGMDDYLMKPLEMDKLETSLSKWVPLGPPPDDGLADNDKGHEIPANSQPGEANRTVIDPRALKDIFGDDDDIFKEILLEFIEPSEDIVREIMAGYQDHDGPTVGAAGHKLKSSSRAVGANQLAEVCADLEKAGKSDDWPNIDQAIAKLEHHMADVTAYIKSL